jgi:hypothetical protein
MALGTAEPTVEKVTDWEAKRREEGTLLAKAVATVLHREMTFEEPLHRITHYSADMGKELAKALSDGLNDFICETTVKAFLDGMTVQHRSLQQTFTGVCLQWLARIAAEDYPTDGRNEYAQKVARKAIAGLELPYDLKLPHI